MKTRHAVADEIIAHKKACGSMPNEWGISYDTAMNMAREIVSLSRPLVYKTAQGHELRYPTLEETEKEFRDGIRTMCGVPLKVIYS